MTVIDMSIKAKIKNVAKETGVSHQEVLQMYLFEHFLLRLSKSDYRKNFILKGGGILAQIFGEWQRTTRDLDATIKGISLNKQDISKIIKEIISININDEIVFTLSDVDDIRQDDIYSGIRVSINAKLGTINENISIDMTTGDIITPRAITFGYQMMFEDSVIKVFAYNVETIIAEKFETIITRGSLTTRAKDFYDIYMLVKIGKYDKDILKQAIKRTFKRRNTELDIDMAESIIEELKSNKNILDLWQKYQKTYKYAENISIFDIVKSLLTIAENIDQK